MVEHDARVEPLPSIDLRNADYAGIRVWVASRPIYDSSPVPDRGVVGYHVHAYRKDGSGKKDVDDTYLSVRIDGLLVPITPTANLADATKGRLLTEATDFDDYNQEDRRVLTVKRPVVPSGQQATSEGHAHNCDSHKGEPCGCPLGKQEAKA